MRSQCRCFETPGKQYWPENYATWKKDVVCIENETITVTHPSTNQAQYCLTSLTVKWAVDSCCHCLFLFKSVPRCRSHQTARKNFKKWMPKSVFWKLTRIIWQSLERVGTSDFTLNVWWIGIYRNENNKGVSLPSLCAVSQPRNETCLQCGLLNFWFACQCQKMVCL